MSHCTGQGGGEQLAQFVEPEEHLHRWHRVRPVPHAVQLGPVLRRDPHVLLQEQDPHARPSLCAAVVPGELLPHHRDPAGRTGEPLVQDHIPVYLAGCNLGHKC